MFGDVGTNSKNLPVVKPEKIAKKISVGGDKPSEVHDEPSEEYKYPIYSNGEKNDGLYGWSKEYRIKDPSITISARGTIGYAVYRETGKYTPIVRLIALIPNDLVDPVYLTYYLNIEREKGNGSGIQQLTVPMFKNKDIILPSLNDQKRFSTFAEQVDKLKFSNSNSWGLFA